MVTSRNALKLKRAAKYRGNKLRGFGAWPRSFMEHKISPSLNDYRRVKQRLMERGKHSSQRSIRSIGVLARAMQGRTALGTPATFGRTEQLLPLPSRASASLV
jgi:hypothetical protein